MKKMMKLVRLFSLLCLALAVTLTSVGCKKVIEQPPTYSEYIEYVPIEDDEDSTEVSSSDDTSDEVSSENNTSGDISFGGNNTVDTEDVGDGKLENGVMVFNVADYGAVGDGKTDDGVAVNEAVNDATIYTKKNSGKKAIVRFSKGKTYVCKTQITQNYDTNSGIFVSADNLTIEGNGAIIIGEPKKTYMRIQGSSNVKVTGLNFTYDYPVACRAKAVKRTTSQLVTFEVPKWYVKCVEENEIANNSFAIPANDRRDISFYDSITKVDDTHVIVNFINSGANGWSIIRTEEEMKTETYNICTQYVDLPTPGYSHNGNAFQVLANPGTVELQNINVWNSSQFTFQVNNNSGNMRFTNVNLTQKDANSCPTVSWRDTVHAKDNRGALTFNNCSFAGTHDDIFNISSTMCEVKKVAGNTLTLYGLDYRGDFVGIKVGNTLIAFNPTTDKYYGEARVKEVTRSPGNIQITTDKNIGIEVGAYLSFKELEAPGTTISGGNFNGSFRIRASGTQINNSNFTIVAMWTAYEGPNGSMEGPIPQNITYKNCGFYYADKKSVGSKKMSFDCYLLNGTPAKSYDVKNIVFEGCKFEHEGMIPNENGVIVKK